MNKQNQMTVVEVDDVLAEYSLDKLDTLAPFQRSIKMAQGMSLMRRAMEPHMPALLELKGSKLGFLCDDGQYSTNEIRDVLMEGMIRGARPVMNEINIIAGQCYLTKEFFARRISERPDVSNLSIDAGLPQVLREPAWEKGSDGKNRPIAGSALISMSASWSQNGVPCRLDCVKSEKGDTRIPIKLNNKYGIDQILGLAESKLLRRVYKRITGSEWVKEDDVDSVPVLEETESAVIEQEPTEIEKFCGAVVGKLARCSDQMKVNALVDELYQANTGDEERCRWIGELASERERQIEAATA